MKKLLFLSTISIALFASCSHNTEVKTETVAIDSTLQYFGDSITTSDAVDAKELAALIKDKDSVTIKLTGTVESVCQKKGCWMNMAIGENQSMKVRFKDYAFFVPKDATGKTVFIEGVAFKDTTSIAELKHYAEDAGQSKEEIEKITQPEININFEAKGVIIKD